MQKIKYTLPVPFQRVMLWVFKILGAVVLVSIFSQAQTVQCDHKSPRMSRFKADGFFPLVARNYDGLRIEWTFIDDQGNYAGTLIVDKMTRLPANFATSYKGRLFWAVYSSCDQYAYGIYEMMPEQIKAFKGTK